MASKFRRLATTQDHACAAGAKAGPSTSPAKTAADGAAQAALTAPPSLLRRADQVIE